MSNKDKKKKFNHGKYILHSQDHPAHSVLRGSGLLLVSNLMTDLQVIWK